MTKQLKMTIANAPDLTGLNPDTTFYVYWDSEGNEHSDIPISQDPPTEWYNYTYSKWANIVTRNNNLETYFVWIPRYQYCVDSISERTKIEFIKETVTQPDYGYQIPDAFTWIDNEGKTIQLSGYWASKYQLSN